MNVVNIFWGEIFDAILISFYDYWKLKNAIDLKMEE
ncbi:hypothetical protein SAMN05443507_11555 [Alicyclobacillus tolerans]|uniref:Uncharacterized protein n=1 Tax=Alicyclobacillus tolerans TaxID=90970 RepID=A0A1M6T2Z2_9BACL|nr:hypothetical protein SAMN05443507_11555 [Alicyclobacillus montanus]